MYSSMKNLNLFKKSALFAGSCIYLTWLTLGACSKEPSFKIDPITPVTVEVRADRETTVGNLNENGFQITLPAGTFDEDVTITVSGSASDVESAYKSTKFERLGSPIDIHVEGTQGTVWLKEMATVSFPLPKGFVVTPQNSHLIFVSYYNLQTKSHEYLYPDQKELFRGRITFAAFHFSDICPVLLGDTEACTKFAYSRAAQWFEEQKTVEAPITGQMLRTSFNDIYEKMGITDGSVKEILIRGAIDECNLYNIALSLEDGDIGGAAARMSELAGNVILEFMQEDPGFKLSLLNKNPAIIQGVVNAGAHLVNGDYKEAGLAVADAIIDIFPPTKYIKIANELINFAVMSWKKNELEALYNDFKKDGITTIHDEEWDPRAESKFAGIARQAGIDAVALYCKVNNISKNSLSRDEEERIMTHAKSSLRSAVQTRLKEEAQIKRKQDEYLDVIRHFKSDGLLDYLSPLITIDARISLLFKIRDKILRVCGGPLSSDDWKSRSPEENLRWATEEYMRYVYERGGVYSKHPGGELAFYDWLVREGFIKADEAITLAECFGSYEGTGKLSTFTSVGGNITESNTQTMTMRVVIEELGQGRMKISLNGTGWPVQGTIAAEGTYATFGAKFNPADIVSYHPPGEGSWNGTIRKADNKVTLSGTLVIDSEWDTTRTFNEYTFTNFTKR